MNDITTVPAAEVSVQDIQIPDPSQPTLEAPEFKYEPEKWFDLVRPVTTHSTTGKGIEQLTRIRLRAPLGGDYLEVGGSYLKTVFVPGGVTTEENPQKFRQWFMRLSGHDGATFAQLAMRDVKKIQDWLAVQLNDSGN